VGDPVVSSRRSASSRDDDDDCAAAESTSAPSPASLSQIPGLPPKAMPPPRGPPPSSARSPNDPASSSSDTAERASSADSMTAAPRRDVQSAVPRRRYYAVARSVTAPLPSTRPSSSLLPDADRLPRRSATADDATMTRSKKRSDSAASLADNNDRDRSAAFFDLLDDDWGLDAELDNGSSSSLGGGGGGGSPPPPKENAPTKAPEKAAPAGTTPPTSKSSMLSLRKNLSVRQRGGAPALSRQQHHPSMMMMTTTMTTRTKAALAPPPHEGGGVSSGARRRAYPGVALERCAALIELRDVAAFAATCREWCDALDQSDHAWREQWMRRLGSYSYLPRRICVLADVASSRDTLRAAVADEKRTTLTLEELTSFVWRFRFKRAAGASWMAIDPYWCRKPAVALKFNHDGTTRRVQVNDLGYPWCHTAGRSCRGGGPMLDRQGGVVGVPNDTAPHGAFAESSSHLDDFQVEWRWGSADDDCPTTPPSESAAATTPSQTAQRRRGSGRPCDRVRARVDGQDVPTYVVSRHPRHKGFLMQSCWALYTAFPMPAPGEDPDLDDERLELAFAARLAPEMHREAREQALRYNALQSSAAEDDDDGAVHMPPPTGPNVPGGGAAHQDDDDDPVQGLLRAGPPPLGSSSSSTAAGRSATAQQQQRFGGPAAGLPPTLGGASSAAFPAPASAAAHAYVDVDAFDAILRHDNDALAALRAADADDERCS